MHIPNSSNIILTDFHTNCAHTTFLWRCRCCLIVRDEQQKPPRSPGLRYDDRMFSLGSGMCWTRVLWFIRSLKNKTLARYTFSLIFSWRIAWNRLALQKHQMTFYHYTTTVLWHEKNVSCPEVPAPNPLPMWSTDTGTCSLEFTIWIPNTVTVSVGEFVVCLTAAKTSACLFLGAEGRVCLCSNPNRASWP